jgi:hypothetical protein
VVHLGNSQSTGGGDFTMTEISWADGPVATSIAMRINDSSCIDEDGFYNT